MESSEESPEESLLERLRSLWENGEKSLGVSGGISGDSPGVFRTSSGRGSDAYSDASLRENLWESLLHAEDFLVIWIILRQFVQPISVLS